MFHLKEKTRWPLVLVAVLFALSCSSLARAATSVSVYVPNPAGDLSGGTFDKTHGPGNGGNEGGDPDELGINAAAPSSGSGGHVVPQAPVPQGAGFRAPTPEQQNAVSRFWESPWVLWLFRIFVLRV